MSQDRDSLLNNGSINSISSNHFDNIESHAADSGSQDTPSYAPPKIFRQLFAGFSACLSALSAGVVLGWTSPILDYLTSGKYNDIPIDNNTMGWIGSFATLGAMAMCIPAGFICDLIGRKKALLALMIPFLLGWSLIIFARTILELYFGRLITGMAVGACCVAAPLYNGEIAHQDIRGKLGSFFQLMICTGIFLAYLVGKFLSPHQFTLFCASMPFVFLVCFVFQPESPNYLMKKFQYENARKALLVLRGENYNVDEELLQIEGHLKESSQSAVSLRSIFSKKSVKVAILISFGLMVFQQMTGINAIILYSSNMFKSVGVHLDPNLGTIMIGLFQMIATFLASLLIEKLGRKLLLFISMSTVTVCCVVIAIYLSVKPHLDNEELKEISFLPVTAFCLFVIAFSFGIGPIPWMISSEIIPTEIRSMVSSTAGTLNWFLAFMVTKVYLLVAGEACIFYIFTVFTLLGTIFVLLVVPETKGKSITQIQEELNNVF
ncbi:facilitated trehalose transporter Tret1-like [Sitophilus oryzae]|uniref:Facilitated trehalose transporter Tret1-like n=1 Tax=Sitophilus oryzae TaxID=7048 RepID=A0A6J2XX16_SITOR|nr:facilitated trehalose transporter Tret1-like [Sitophilus oryzae]